MRKGMVMSRVLLVKLEFYSMLYRADSREGAPFLVWRDGDGVDLYWMGRRVERLYTEGRTSGCWYSAPVPAAAESLLKSGAAKSWAMKVPPSPEGELPS